MKYKQLPSEKLIQKLLSTSFESPSANRDVYNWSESVLKHIKFLENERIKLVMQYGKDDGTGNCSVKSENYETFFNKFKDILEMEIDEDVEKCPIQSNWFDDEKCEYPKDKKMWITPNEIGILLNFNKKEGN